MRKNFIRTLCALALAALAVSCQSAPPTVKQESPEGPVPRDLTQRYIHQVIYGMRDGFAAKDVSAFMKYVSDGFYRGRSRLEENLRQTIATLGPIVLSVEIGDVEEDGQKITAVVKWRRSAAGAAEDGMSGETILLFHKTDRISLVDFRKDPLFGIEGL